jgi:hypothetical protein
MLENRESCKDGLINQDKYINLSLFIKKLACHPNVFMLTSG